MILPSREYERLIERAKAPELPPYPEPDAHGNFPAIEYMRVSIARSILRERIVLDLTRRELARLAGVRVGTLGRIEAGLCTPSTTAIDKLDRALKRVKRAQAELERKSSRKRRSAS